VDSRLDSIEVEIDGQDYVLRQSPALLTSNRKEGTTGAVLWKITPLLAAWLATLPALLSDLNILSSDATVVELGCGLSGLIGLVLSRVVKRYVLTDQAYVMKYLKENISANSADSNQQAKALKKGSLKSATRNEILKTLPLDWETDSAENLKSVIAPGGSIDLLLLCDCVYNEYLVEPLVQTCIDICRLGSMESVATTVLISQQLRSDTIFALFLDTLMKHFDVWRVPDEAISQELRSGSGYAVHLAVLKRSPR